MELGEAYAHEHIAVIPGPYVQLTVTDSGIGMDRETVSRVFEPFFTTKLQGRGSGLGLATVYGIIRNSGGHIWVYSEPGSGTSFKIYLPRISQLSEEVAPARAADESPQGRETVLLVEDAPLLAKVTRNFLELNGHVVLSASHADEAIRVAESFPGLIHLLLTDVVMPHMNGRELSQRLLAKRPEMKVLFMSGHTAGIISQHALLDEGVAFLEKPFTIDALTRKVRDSLAAGRS